MPNHLLQPTSRQRLAAEQHVGRARSASLVPRERIMPSMNDNDRFKAVRGQEALDARPPNGARVARGCRPLGRRAKLRFVLRPRGAAQLALR